MAAQPKMEDHTHIEGAPGGDDVVSSNFEKDIEQNHVVTQSDVQKYTEEDDEAMKAFAEYDGPPLILDAETKKRLLRTIDWHVMPIM